MRVARAVVLDKQEQGALEQLARGRSLPARLVERARIVLRAAAGLQDQQIAGELGITPEKAARWRNRYLDGGINALEKDASRPGRPRTITEARTAEVIHKTTQEKPFNATHWSTRTMAAATGLSETTVRGIWHGNGLKPPEHAIVLCADEKSQIQALDRTQPGLPIKKGRCGTMTHDYKRNGTATLFAAMNALDGTVISMCDDRHRHQEWLKFLRVIDEVTPGSQEIHLIADNYATHKHPRVQKWLARHPRFHIYFTPTSSSWLNMVERFFRDITQNRLRRGIFRDVEELIMAIGEYIDKHNDNPKPFVWTAKATDILEKVKRARKALDIG